MHSRTYFASYRIKHKQIVQLKRRALLHLNGTRTGFDFRGDTCKIRLSSRRLYEKPFIRRHIISTIFSRILSGEIPSAKLYDDNLFYAFLDVRPIRMGHALLIPKQAIDYIFDLHDDLLQKMLVVARPIAKAIEQHIPCKKVGLMVAGLEVRHCHLHLVPIDDVGDLNFGKAQAADFSDLQLLAEKIRHSLSQDT